MNNNFKTIFCIVFVWVLFGSCHTQEKYTAIINIQDAAISNEQIENTAKLLKQRLALLKDDKAEIIVDIENKQLVIQSTAVATRSVVDYVITTGKLSFRECYMASEAYPLIGKAIESLDKPGLETNKQIEISDLLKPKNNSGNLLNLLALNKPGPGYMFNAPEVAYVKVSDTLALRELLISLYQYLPKNIRFLYGTNQHIKDANTLPLYAVKFDGGNIIDNQYIDKIAFNYSSMKQPLINMNFNKEGASRWALMTKKNINRPIAIVIDELVYSAPTVVSEITGGSSQISGGLSVQETQSLVSAIAGGYLPLKLKLHSLDKTQKK